jgi:hypothetical protein
MNKFLKTFLMALIIFLLAISASPAANITGASESPDTLRQWHRITLTIDGPASSETANPNPFMDYRMNVTFEHTTTGTTYTVPGYFAADGNAANTSASSGNKWRAHLCPDYTGTWNYTVSFREGPDIAVSSSPTAGTALDPYDLMSGSFTVVASEKSGRDMRAKGRLQYVGKHFLKFAGNGEYFVKQGADAPENFLAYEDFDGSFKTDGKNDHFVKSWQPHFNDWNDGDPLWQGDKGKEIIGAINYLASEGLNAFSCITMNIAGDDKNVFPYLHYDERYRMDCSKLAQWEIVFEHADRMGMFIHFKTQETENELLLDDGDLGIQRKLYYRELIARFGHHLAMNWNLGEEVNDASTTQKKAWAQYFYDNDPYNHHIVIHNGANHYDLMGPGSKLTGFSLQTGRTDFSSVFARTKDYIERSLTEGKPWAVACDEPGDAQHALRPDDDAGSSHEQARKNALWGVFMAGGWGNEWYFGYDHAHSDLTCEDFRSRDQFWDYCRYAVDFFTARNSQNRKPVPVQNMENADARVSGTDNHCLYGNDDDGKPCIVVSTENGGSFTLNAPQAPLYKVGWMNAKTGLWQYADDIVNHNGGELNFTAPHTNDWILLLYDWNAGCNRPDVDIVEDGQVNFNDLLAIAQRWMLTDCCANDLCDGADLDASNRVDIGDIAVLSKHWLEQIEPTVITRYYKPVDDAYKENSSYYNDQTLRVENANRTRTSYLKFSVQDIPEDYTVTNVTLELVENGDYGNGTLRFHRGDSNDWTENNLNADNEPSPLEQVAINSYSVEQDEVIMVDVTSLVTGNGTYTVIITMDSGGNDIWFGSEEAEGKEPKKIITLQSNKSST